MTLISTLSAFSARFVERVHRGATESGSDRTTRPNESRDRSTGSAERGLRPVDENFRPRLAADPSPGSVVPAPAAEERVPIGRRGAGDEVWFDSRTDAFTGVAHCAKGLWVRGNLGRACLKTAPDVVASDVRFQAPVVIFDSEQQLLRACEEGELDRDCVAVLRFQGQKARGRRKIVSQAVEALDRVRSRGWSVALVTDGTTEGAEASVPIADNLSPEGLCNGTLRRIRPGDLVRLDLEAGQLELMVDDQRIQARDPASPSLRAVEAGAKSDRSRVADQAGV